MPVRLAADSLDMSQAVLGSFTVEFLRLCAWFVLLAAVFVPLERLWGLRRQKFLRRDFAPDLGYYFLSGLVPKLLLLLPLTLLAAALHKVLPVGYFAAMGAVPMGVRLLAALVVGEAGSYWGHRWSHEIPLLWRFHAVHHSAEEMDWLVNTRAHPVDLAFVRLCSMAPLYVLGLAQPLGDRVDVVPMLVTVIGTFWGFFIHANVKWRLGWMEQVVTTPGFHHWHHTNESAETLNKNYASLLPWLDRCFGTYYLPSETWPTQYGLDSAESQRPAIPRTAVAGGPDGAAL